MSEIATESDELRRLRAWKQEAMTLFDGLQDLGRALDLPLGVLITGPLAIEAANNLRADRDKYLAAFSEQFDQREEYATECKRMWPMEERLEEAEAAVARVEALCGRCVGSVADDASGGEPLRNFVMLAELRAALKGGA